MSMPTTDKPPFIATQQVLLLDEGVAHPRRHVGAELFRKARRGEDVKAKDRRGHSILFGGNRQKTVAASL